MRVATLASGEGKGGYLTSSATRGRDTQRAANMSRMCEETLKTIATARWCQSEDDNVYKISVHFSELVYLLHSGITFTVEVDRVGLSQRWENLCTR